MHVYMCIHAHMGVGTRMGVVSVCMHTCTYVFCACLGIGTHMQAHRHRFAAPLKCQPGETRPAVSWLLLQAHNCTRKDFEKMYPGLPEVLCHPRKAGPHRMFLNAYLRRCSLKHKQKTSLAHLISPSRPTSHRAAQCPAVLMGNRHFPGTLCQDTHSCSDPQQGTWFWASSPTSSSSQHPV